MTVLTIVTKSDSFQIKGDIKTFKNITKIVEKKDVIELIRNENYATIMNKERNRIIAIEY